MDKNQIVADMVKDIEEVCTDNTDLGYDDLLAKIAPKVHEVREFAAENGVLLVLDEGLLAEMHAVDEDSYEEESSSYYEEDEEESCYDDDDDED